MSENDDKEAQDPLSIGSLPTLLINPAAAGPGSTQLLSPDRPRPMDPAEPPRADAPAAAPDPNATMEIARADRTPPPPPPRNNTLPSAAPSTHKAAVGKVIAGKYELVRQLGAGGMGTVWKAQHLSLGINVAVKTMHPYVAMQDEYVRRFRREAHAASLLNHPNAVRVIDFGEENGLLYLVMEYLDGRSLASWLDSLPGPPRIVEVGRILGLLLDAFEVAHANGIVHRDLKPDNVFLAEVGDQHIVKVLDFGLAHVDDARDVGPTLTQRDAVAGTPDYMSPEQCRSLAVGPSADLYSIGCVLTTMLQLRAPFAGGSSIDTMAKHMFARPPALLRPDDSEPVPPLLEKLRLDLLAKVPERRPRDAAETKRRLLEALSPAAAEARLPTRKGEVPLGDRSSRASWGTDARDASPGSVRSEEAKTIGVLRLQPPAEAVGIGPEHETALSAQQIEIVSLDTPDAVASSRVPLVVLDMGSSIPEGRAVLEQIRKASPSTRVIVCAARLGAGQLNELVAAGAADVARYPITPDGLARKIERVLRRGR